VWAWVRVVGQGRCEEGAQLSLPLGGGCAAAGGLVPTVEEAMVAQPATCSRQVVGYIVSASPKGLSPPSLVRGADGLRTHAGYPGGLALCDLAALWDARADLFGNQGPSCRGSSSRTCVRVDERVVPVALRNPRSPVYRRAEFWLVLEQSVAPNHI